VVDMNWRCWQRGLDRTTAADRTSNYAAFA
jgi:hypothetical protein